MKTTVVCKDVRPATEGNKECVVVACSDEPQDVREVDVTDALILAGARDSLRAQGMILGGPLQAARTAGTQSKPDSPVEIIAHDEDGQEQRLIADHSEEYCLSSGSTLYYFYISELPGDCRWLVGRTLEIVGESKRTLDVGDGAGP